MKELKVIAVFLLLLSSPGCWSYMQNDQAFEILWKALEVRDRAVLPQVRIVLLDALRHGDRYNHETRKTAFEVIRETDMRELLPLVRKIAAMDYRPAPLGADLYDLVAISEALTTLREWQDSAAISLSLRRLNSDPWLQTTAIDNLRLMRYWQATPDIQGLLGGVPKNPENLLVVRKMIAYLLESRISDKSPCGVLAILPESYPFCFRGDGEPWRCGSLGTDTRSLVSRLRCPEK